MSGAGESAPRPTVTLKIATSLDGRIALFTASALAVAIAIVRGLLGLQLLEVFLCLCIVRLQPQRFRELLHGLLVFSLFLHYETERIMRLVLIGIVIGLVGALLLARLMESMLFGVDTWDPVTLVSVTLVLVATAVGACLVPAWRGTRVDPLVALRYQ